MTEQDFLTKIKERNVTCALAATPGQINLVNLNLQKIRAAMLPSYMISIYQKYGGMKLGSGYIFGPTEFASSSKYPTPNIFQINSDLTNIPSIRGKTIFGRNDLFWFAFDSFGTCFMLDNLGLSILRQYDDPYRAILDCLMGGKI
ncbi:MAG: hypothetical protein J5742_00340 [Alphaproteobacteria bacterium]|nr:hypothetical protein [Alphaproteobacteria bacterium]